MPLLGARYAGRLIWHRCLGSGSWRSRNSPPGGDGFRSWPPQIDQGDGERYGLNIAVLNRNKRSIVLDLKDAADRERFLSLCTKADVLIENNRPGAMDRLGLGFAEVKRVQPRIVYCSVSGYGHEGPYS